MSMRNKILYALALAAFFGLVLFTRLVPLTVGDREIFVSVGERLVAGDTLYAGVFDNKDPLFYYLVALERAAGPLAEYLAELAAVLVAIASVFAIGRRLHLAAPLALGVAFFGVPLLVLGRVYEPGTTMIAGTALVLAVAALVVVGRPALAGATLALLFFTKLVLVPVAGVFALVYALSAAEAGHKARRLAAGIGGFVVLAAAVSALLALRGEFRPWLETQAGNFLYSQGILVGGDTTGEKILHHLLTVWAYGPLILLATVAGAIVIALLLVLAPERGGGRPYLGATLTAQLVTLAVTIMTVIWPHHLQLTNAANALALVSVAVLLASRLPALAAGAIVLVVAVLLSGTLNPRIYLAGPRGFLVRLHDLTLPAEQATALRAATSGPAAYARLGQNDDGGHATGLADYTLVCPSIQQYPFYSADELARARACADTAPYLIVTSRVEPMSAIPGWYPPYTDGTDLLPVWNAHVAAVESMLANDYVCTPFGDRGRICKRKTAP